MKENGFTNDGDCLYSIKIKHTTKKLIMWYISDMFGKCRLMIVYIHFEDGSKDEIPDYRTTKSVKIVEHAAVLDTYNTR